MKEVEVLLKTNYDYNVIYRVLSDGIPFNPLRIIMGTANPNPSYVVGIPN